MDERLEKTLPYGRQRPLPKKRQLAQPRGVVDAPQLAGEVAVRRGDELVGGQSPAVRGIGRDLAGAHPQQDPRAAQAHDARTRGGGPQPQVVVFGDGTPVPPDVEQRFAPRESGGVRVGAVEQQGEPTRLDAERHGQGGQPQPRADDLEGREDEVGAAVEGGELVAEPAGQADVVGIHAGDDVALRLVEQQGEPAGDPEVLVRDREADAAVAEAADELGRAIARRIVEDEHLGVVGEGAEGGLQGGPDGARGVARGQQDAEAGHDDSLAQGGINPADHPVVRAVDPQTPESPVPTLGWGSPLPEGTTMLRTAERAAPRHAPRIRIGCDVHPIADLAESVELFGERYLARVFTPLEREQCAGPTELERLAGRFAAKEAVIKVLQLPTTAVVPWQSIEVRTGRNGVPFVVLTGRAAALAGEQGIDRIDISLSHDAGIAMAVAAAIPTGDDA